LSFDRARSALLDEANGPDLRRVEIAAANFKSNHPYLLFHKPALSGIRKRANGNRALMLRLHSSLGEQKSVVPEEELRTTIKRRSRRLIHTSFLAMISNGAKRTAALEAARTELSRLMAESSWKPRPVIKSFLDCAEIAVAVALAYDWLYDELPEQERVTIEASLFRHVLEPAITAYEDRFAVWPKRRDNCTLVSNSGILVASLAVLQRYRQPAIQLLSKSLASSWRIFDALAPDGAWPEGLSYWSLVMRYAGLMVAALESTFDQSFGLADRPGFAQTGDFALHAVGPSGAAFNFGDSEVQFDVSSLAWFAHRYRRPTDARLIEDYDGWYLPFTMIWASRARTRHSLREPPTGKVFYSSDVACFRNSWSSDPRARPVYLAIKGGNLFRGGAPRSSRAEQVVLHAQADAGSFVVDGARHRWVIDLGPDDYDLPGYFDHGADHKSGPRWQYYRTQTAGHNTLTIDGRNQLPNARAPIIAERVTGACKWVVFDLSAAYGKAAGSIRRGAALIGRQVIIQDEVAPEVCGDIVWALHTAAEPVSVAGSLARFRLGEDCFVVRVLEPLTACFEIALPPESRSFPIPDVRRLHGRSGPVAEGTWVSELPRRVDHHGERAAGALIRRLQIVWPSGARRLAVALFPDCEGDGCALPIAPLSEWLAKRPIRLAWFHHRDSVRAGRRQGRTSAGTALETLPRTIGMPRNALEVHAASAT
jgi:Heparinase II/III-like protein